MLAEEREEASGVGSGEGLVEATEEADSGAEETVAERAEADSGAVMAVEAMEEVMAAAGLAVAATDEVTAGVWREEKMPTVVATMEVALFLSLG